MASGNELELSSHKGKGSVHRHFRTLNRTQILDPQVGISAYRGHRHLPVDLGASFISVFIRESDIIVQINLFQIK